jgi:hypothetical protein
VFKNIKRTIKKMFREILVYHHSSMEYRAKILTLMVSANGEICECEKKKLKEIAHSIYGNDSERAEILIDTVYEYHTKIITNNGLNFNHLIQLVEKESKVVPRYVNKIDIPSLRKLHECIKDEEDRRFQEHILEFLETLKEDMQKKV